MKRTAALFYFYALSKTLFAQDWSVPFSFDSSGTFVYVLYADTTNDSLYVGGEFFRIDGQLMDGIVSFNGNGFNNLGGGSNCNNIYCAPTTAIFRYKGELYASIETHGIAGIDSITTLGRWNGKSWRDVGGYVGHCTPGWQSATSIYKMIEEDGKLYAAGYFNCINYDTIQAVAAWDGENWIDVGMPSDWMAPTGVPLMNSVAVFKNQLYAVGKSYLKEDGEDVSAIYRYDTIVENRGWHSVGGGLKGIATALDLAEYKGELYVGGYFLKAQGNAGNGIMRWDGVSWKDVGGGIDFSCGIGGIRRLFVFDGKLLAIGEFNCIGGITANNIATWDGERWCSVGKSTFDGPIIAAAMYKNDLYIGGAWRHINGVYGTSFAKFIGDPADNICGNVPTTDPESPENQLIISPNPATQAIRITLPTNPATLKISVFNTLGQPVLSKTIENLPEPAIVLEVGVWPSGVYFVEIRTEDGQVWGGRFVKG